MTAIVQRPDLLTVQRRCAFDGARQAMLRLFADRIFTETAPDQRAELLEEIVATLRAMGAIFLLNEDAGDV